MLTSKEGLLLVMTMVQAFRKTMMNNTKINGEELADFANSCNSGHLKLWKANSIIFTIQRMPEILTNEFRGINYVTNCLEMEGFLKPDCEKIFEFLKNNC